MVNHDRAASRSKTPPALLILLGLLVASTNLLAQAPRGVFCLLPADAGNAKDPLIYTNPDVDGISARQGWCDLEPAEGAFDWTFLNDIVSKAAAGGKKVFLRIGTSGGDAAMGGNTPSWVFDAIRAEALPISQKFVSFEESGVSYTIPVFWDPVYVAKKKAMIAAVGAHFSNHPAVKIVAVSFANSQTEDWSVPHTPVDVASWFAAGYSTEKLLDAGRQIIDATMTAFPYQYVTLAIGGNGHDPTGSLDPDDTYVARNAMLTARADWPSRLIVQRNSLAATTPPAPGTGTRWQSLSDNAPNVAGQMVWFCSGDTTYRVNGGVAIDPSTALRRSVDIGLDYGMQYIEIYRVDILNLPAVVHYAHDALTAALPSPTPTPSATPTPAATATPSSTPTPTPTPSGTWTDLRVSVTDPATSVVAGQNDTYTIVVTNTGPYSVTGAVITDNFPSTFAGVTFTAIQTGGASGFSATGIGSINDTVTIPVGGFITYKATGRISSAATTAISNAASVTLPDTITDTNLANNSATDTNAITSQTNLKISVDDGNNAVFVGQNDIYTIVLSNSGPSDAIGVIVSDSFPGNFSGVSFTATQVGGASGFTAAGSGNISDVVTLPADSRIIYKAKGVISSPGTGTISNSASVAAGSAPDPNLADNTAIDTDTIASQADLSVAVDDGKKAALMGENDTYTIVVVNSGPTDVTGALVKDNFPSNFTGVTFTASQVGGASGFTANGTGNINDTVTLPANSRIIYKAKGLISSADSGSIANTATVTAPAGMPDPNRANNSATDVDTIALEADLKITVDDGDSALFVGQNNTYTIVVSNSGPSDVTGAVVRDIFPSNFTGVTFTATQVGGASGFTATGSGSVNDIVTLPADSRIIYKAKGAISSAGTGTISNTATVTCPTSVPDPQPANNSATDTDSIASQADLKVTVTDGKTSLAAGDNNTYTIVLTNLGPSAVSGAIVQDNFPAAFTGVTYIATQTGGASGFTANGTGNINDAVTLPAGSHITYKAKGTISSTATLTLSDTATLSAPNGTPDPDLANNTATDTDQL